MARTFVSLLRMENSTIQILTWSKHINIKHAISKQSFFSVVSDIPAI